MIVFSPAKLNLFFRVLGKRKDGFHEVASLMQAVSLGDTLTFKKNIKSQITSSNSSLTCDETNLIHQACTLFQKKTGYSQPLHIHVEKKIPIKGGLGGGSSNAATTLWAINKLSKLNIDEKELQKWAGQISSDSPFFFSKGTAFSTGRGEQIENREFKKDHLPLWLACPNGEGLSTIDVYNHFKPKFYKNNFDNPDNGSNYFNDLEYSAFYLRPDLADLKKKLYKIGFKIVVMTGSGNTFFCFGSNKPKLEGVHFIRASYIHRDEGWYVTNSH